MVKKMVREETAQYKAAAATRATIKPAMAVPGWSATPSFLDVVETGEAASVEVLRVGAATEPEP